MVDWFLGTVPQGTSSPALHNTARSLYEDETGDWVFRTPEWKNWIDCRKRGLWIHGIPGAGKTVLASYVIERTRSICETKGKKEKCIYYYCYHGRNQDETTPFLRWLVSQLLQGLDEMPRAAYDTYESCAEPDFQQLLSILGEALRSFDRIYVAIDALDESQSRIHLLSLLEKLIMETRFAKIQLLATSREYEDISRKMISISQPLSMSNSFVEADIRLYVAAKIRENPRFQRWPEDLRIEVENALSTGAKGMFRWAVCQLDILRRLHPKFKIREAIRSLPETLDETYERIFSCIDVEDQDLVRHALHLVCFDDFLWNGRAPLPARVLLDSYGVLNQTNNRPTPNDFLPNLDTLKEVCGCLASFSHRAGGDAAYIAHYTPYGPRVSRVEPNIQLAGSVDEDQRQGSPRDPCRYLQTCHGFDGEQRCVRQTCVQQTCIRRRHLRQRRPSICYFSYLESGKVLPRERCLVLYRMRGAD